MSSREHRLGRFSAITTKLLLVCGVLAVMVTALVIFPLRPYDELPNTLRIDEARFCGIAAGIAEGIALSCASGETVRLPALLPTPGGDQVSSAKFRVEFTASPDDGLQAIMMPRQWDNLQVAINGVWITPQRSEGRLWHDWNKPTYLPLAAPLLSSERNTVDVVVSGEGLARLALYPFYVGDPDRLRLSWLNYFSLRTGIVRTDGTIAVLIGLIFLVFWRSLPPSMGAAWLIATMAATALYSFQWSYPNVAPDAQWWEMLVVLSPTVAVYGTFRFLQAFLDRPLVQSHLAFDLLAAMSMGVYVIGMVLGTDLSAWSYIGTGGLVLLLMACLLSYPLRQTPRLQWILVGVLGLATACGFIGWLQSYTSLAAELPDLLVLSPALLHIAVGWTLLERLVQLKREREEANARLEADVQRKSAEIERIYAELSAQQRLQAISDERQRIMLDLHDGVGGHLVNTLAYVETAYGDDEVLHGAIEDALRDMGLMVDSLNSHNDIATMLGMLRDRIEPLLERHSARFVWAIANSPRLPEQNPSQVTALMRIVQEAITNAVKHSGATQIQIQADTNTISIHDNGRGFEPDTAQHRRSGIGIAGMGKRADDLGINFSVYNSPSGASIRLSW